MIFCMFVVGEINKKTGFAKQLFLQKKNHESAEFTNKKHGKPTLHSLIAKHALEMSIKLRFQCERFEKIYDILLLTPVHTMRLVSYHSCLLLS